MRKDKTITRAQYRWALHRPLDLHPGETYTSIKQPYFFSYVIDELERIYGANTVREGGLRVYTTIEPRLPGRGEQGDQGHAEPPRRPGGGDRLGRARDGRDPGDDRGHPRQHGRTSSTSPPSRRARPARRSSRSCSPRRSSRASTPTRPTTPRRRSPARSSPWCVDDYKAGKPWVVTTYDHTYAGSISITNATLRSDNTVYAQLTLDVGPDYVWRMAKRLGLHLTQKPVASIGLGSLSVSPLEMAAAYATFASGGIYARPTAIRKVVLPGGKVDKTAGWGKPHTKRALSRRRRLEGQRDARRERALRHRRRARATASIRTRARRGRPRITPTPGSSATRATSRRRSGWAIRAARSRCSPCTGRRSRAQPSRCRSGTSTWRPPSANKPVRQFLDAEPRARLHGPSTRHTTATRTSRPCRTTRRPRRRRPRRPTHHDRAEAAEAGADRRAEARPEPCRSADADAAPPPVGPLVVR